MVLIGQYDSRFVRGVAIAMRLYGMPFEHRPWSVFGDADRIAQYNPLTRVPTLVLKTGEALIESQPILDALHQLASPGAVMIPAGGAERREAMKVCAVATELCDKAGSLVYEGAVHKRETQAWVDRPCGHRGCLRCTIPRRCASRPVRPVRGLASAGGPWCALRITAAVSGDTAGFQGVASRCMKGRHEETSSRQIAGKDVRENARETQGKRACH